MQLVKSATSAVLAASLITSANIVAIAGNNQLLNIPENELKWEVTKEGVGFAPLQGDRFKESYMAMVRLPAGLVSPAHIKSANMYGMVVSGTITNNIVGAAPSTETELPIGSFYKIPAGLAHVSKCVSKVDCVTFLFQDGKFDFLPIKQ